nr:hypothetical protein OG999_13180 [Streptomyces sp. NBC_00886]
MASHVSGAHSGAAARSSETTGIGSGWLVFAAALVIFLANFLWIPYAPFWAFVLIAINGFVIWALCTAPSPSER